MDLIFDKRTIVVTALTGSAAVSINGETTHSACQLNHKDVTQDDEWIDTIMVIVDEVSFAKKEDMAKLDANLNLLCDVTRSAHFGNLPVVLAGDFSQLKPVKGTPLFVYKDLSLWKHRVNTFLELKTNHRFRDDPDWGKLLQRFRDTGPTKADVDFINKRINFQHDDLPDNIAYATSTNVDRCAINRGIFSEHVKRAHSTNINDPVPSHTIIVLASDMEVKEPGNNRKYVEMSPMLRNIIHTCCCDAHIKQGSDECKRIDPALVLTKGAPVMITDNIDVSHSIANGAMCTVNAVKLKNGLEDCNTINVDGHFVRCVEANKVEHIELTLQEGDTKKVLQLKANSTTANAEVPAPILECKITHNTERVFGRIKLTQFPLNVSHARTVHKLQGRSLDNLFIHTWAYTDNWIYVVLSRLRSSTGLYVKKPLIHAKTRGMSCECRDFHQNLRNTKQPLSMDHIRSLLSSNIV